MNPIGNYSEKQRLQRFGHAVCSTDRFVSEGDKTRMGQDQ